MWNHSGWPKASLPFHFLSQQGVPEAQPLLVTSTPASTQILQTNVQFTLQQQPTARPTSSKDTLEGKLTIAGLIFSDCDISYSISKPAAKRGIYTQRTRRDTADAALFLCHIPTPSLPYGHIRAALPQKKSSSTKTHKVSAELPAY